MASHWANVVEKFKQEVQSRRVEDMKLEELMFLVIREKVIALEINDLELGEELDFGPAEH